MKSYLLTLGASVVLCSQYPALATPEDGEGALGIGHLSWSPDGMRIAFDKDVAKTGGGMNKHIFITRLDNGQVTQITNGDTKN